MDFQLYKSVMSGLIDFLGGRQYFASKVLTPYCYTIGKQKGVLCGLNLSVCAFSYGVRGSGGLEMPSGRGPPVSSGAAESRWFGARTTATP